MPSSSSSKPASSCATPSWRSSAARSSRRSPASSASCRSRPATPSPTPVADRHGRRPLLDHHRFLGAGALRGRRQVGAPLSATPIARPKDVFRARSSAVDNRIDESQPHAAGPGRIDNPGRYAARRHVVPGRRCDSPATPIRRSIRWRSSGVRTAPSSGRSRTARKAHAGPHHPAQYRDGAGRSADLARRRWW